MTSAQLPPALAEALRTAADRWSSVPSPWLVGGSCGLTYHEVPIAAAPRDLDIYVDAEGADAFHRALADFAVDEQQYNETERYRSVLSHYAIGGVTVELVAGFEVREPGALYRVDIAGAMRTYALRADANGASIGVMPLAHELAFNLLRHRPDRYERIAAAMRSDLPSHLPALIRILEDNRFDENWRARLLGLLDVPGDILGAAGEATACRE
ncbi:hypothetical protein FE782_06865 [Paenibacillus antri]|uniref:Nucleotidyltransferase family protein n=1 Tax=Paenibacillus antri TaxID=2582848 RepID=A0A5R9GI43_9BACL|nr:hypothetical protein [Paenibacillus antri]TLS53084.1 hypothetical protein FE782_06865 [Paenibacillus antri]